jgi:hypothetical protein
MGNQGLTKFNQNVMLNVFQHLTFYARGEIQFLKPAERRAQSRSGLQAVALEGASIRRCIAPLHTSLTMSAHDCHIPGALGLCHAIRS